MSIVFDGFWTREQVAGDPDRLYIFGDNLVRKGTAGQACIRGLPNAIGIPTKKYPSMQEGSFFTDDEYEKNCAYIDTAIKLLKARRHPKIIVLPSGGLGTGLAQMPTRCPRTFAYLNAVLADL